MIVACENCSVEFKLDESLIKEEGSKVRCSACKHIFMVYPQEQDMSEDTSVDEYLEETVALDSPPVFSEIESESADEPTEDDFEKAFEDALDDVSVHESLDEQPGAYSETTEEEFEGPLEEQLEESSRPSIVGLRKKSARYSSLLVAMIAILILIIAGLSIFLFAPGLLPDSLSFLKPAKEDLLDMGFQGLDFKDVSGIFLANQEAGQLFVIRGEVINNNPKERSNILIKGSILDNKGKTVKQRLIYAGNTFPDDELKVMPLEEVEKALKNRLGKGNSNVDVKPGSSIPFLIIFENLPDNLGEFMVEAVSSSKGK